MSPASSSSNTSLDADFIQRLMDESDESTSEASSEAPEPVMKKTKVQKDQTTSKKRAAPRTPSLSPIPSLYDDSEPAKPRPIKKVQKTTKKRASSKVRNPSSSPAASDGEAPGKLSELVKKEQTVVEPQEPSQKCVSPEIEFASSLPASDDQAPKEPEPATKKRKVEAAQIPSKEAASSVVEVELLALDDEALEELEPIKKKQKTEKTQESPSKKQAPSSNKAAPSSEVPWPSIEEKDTEIPEPVKENPKVKKAPKKQATSNPSLARKGPSGQESEGAALVKMLDSKGAGGFDGAPRKERKPHVKADPVWYFQPSEPPPDFSAFQTTFHRAVYHVVEVGNVIHRLQSSPDGKWIEPPTLPDGSLDAEKIKEKKTAIKKLLSTDPRTRDISDLKLLRYLEMALSTWSDGDKYMPLRMHAPSMLLISMFIPSYEDPQEPKKEEGIKANEERQALAIFRLVILRVFGVANPALIHTLATASTPAEAESLVMSSFAADKKGLARPVYGQVNLPRGVIPKIIARCDELALKLARSIHGQKEELTFKQVEDIIVATEIYAMKKGGILTWLFTCDLAALGYCAEATWDDLANKMGIADPAEGENEVKSKSKGRGKRKVAVRKQAKKKQAAEVEDADEAGEDEDEKPANPTVKNKEKEKAKTSQADETDDIAGTNQAETNEDENLAKPATKGKGKGKVKAEDPEEDSNAKSTADKKRKRTIGGGSGPTKGLELIIDMAKKLSIANTHASSSFDPPLNIAAVMESKTLFIRECKTVVEVLNAEFREKFDELGMSRGILPRDMEHFFCKISRMEGRGKFEFAK